MEKLQTSDLSHFLGKHFFDDDGSQKCVVFQPVLLYLKITTTANNYRTLESKSKEFSNEIIKPLTSADNSLAPFMNSFDNSNIELKFKRSCLKQDEITFTYRNVVNLYIGYEIKLCPHGPRTEFTVGYC